MTRLNLVHIDDGGCNAACVEHLRYGPFMLHHWEAGSYCGRPLEAPPTWGMGFRNTHREDGVRVSCIYERTASDLLPRLDALIADAERTFIEIGATL